MQTGYLHSMETMGLFDGPGIRTVFFLQGCPIRCAYCHNPDSQACDTGRTIEVKEVLDTARRFRPYYGSDGGVTFSGGEPLLQGAFLRAALSALKKEGFNTTVDTSGFGDPRYYSKVLPLVDTLLLDVKEFSDQRFQELTAGKFQTFLDFMNGLKDWGFKGRIWVRHVMVPGMTDNEESMRELVKCIFPIAEFVERIEILPYHTMGVAKYTALNREYPLAGVPPMDREEAKDYEIYARRYFRQYLGRFRSRKIA
ncbi:MAG: pyruvate formate-lyase-activating protein [Eubacteriales bacterium]|nr:pyruvate formate-lyase-activating protein [Eubacteriales bacterium]